MTSTICAIATARGGAIGIIRVSGLKSIEIVDGVFRGRCSLKDASGYSVHFGQILNTDTGACVDEVLVTLFRAPHSYTGEDAVEISAHGSPYILQTILSILVSKGCRMAEPGEFTKRAYLNGKMDLSQAEAVADLIAAQNVSQHRIAMTQMRGGISNKLKELRDKLLHLTSLLELELDFSDHEELEFANRDELNALTDDLEKEITRLADSFKEGNAIKKGVPVAIVGAPNVGKSTLLNALLQDDKAIVSDIAGTTRDTIEDTITINGVLYRFIDTAGIRETKDVIESLGIERSRMTAQKAQIIIMMRDGDNDYPDIQVNDEQAVIRVFNKSEQFQAINGTGIEKLKAQLESEYNRLIGDSGEDDVLVTNTRHQEALLLAMDDIKRTKDALSMNLSGDLIAEDLRQCLAHLSSITGGEITPDEVLGNIFSHFCIGK